ncbi:hypothetical protein [Synechococcus sp. M16CYN]
MIKVAGLCSSRRRPAYQLSQQINVPSEGLQVIIALDRRISSINRLYFD